MKDSKITILENNDGDERDVVNQLLGQAQMAGAFEEFSRTVRTSKLAYVKENKLYKAMAGQKNPHGAELKGTWEEYCNLLGRSVDQIDRDIASLKAFGEEALESMSRMGIGYREMRQYRKLPDDRRQALIEAAETGDKERFVEVAEDIVSLHEKDKASVVKERDDAKADYTAQSDLLKNKSEELDAAKLELEKARRHLQGITVEKKTKEVRSEISATTFEVEALLMGRMHEGFELLFNEEQGKHTRFMAAQLKQIELQVIALRDEFGLPEDIGDVDELDWLETVGNEEEQFDFVEGEFIAQSDQGA